MGIYEKMSHVSHYLNSHESYEIIPDVVLVLQTHARTQKIFFVFWVLQTTFLV
jgi:hypothetical protein